MTNPRRMALDVLKKMHASGQYSNIAVDKALSSYDMNDADRGLFTAIVMGVSERQLTLDYFIDRLSEKSSKTDIDARIILRIGLYQLMFFDRIPPYAAINETVSIAPRRIKGFINAVLRSYLRKKDTLVYPDKEREPLEYLSVRYSFPMSLCERFVQIFGFDRTCNIFEYYNQAPPMTLRINTLKISREEYAALLSECGIGYELTKYAPDGIKTFGTSYSDLPGADEGLFFVQDEASQICVEALGAKDGDFIIDCCSCPGSKSFGAAIDMNNTGKILSCDLHKSKLSLVESGARRLGINIISIREIDARGFDEALFESADILLCDAPCSGFGVIAKKPEIRYKDFSQSDKLPGIQSDILNNVSKYVKPGGVLVYSTCTVFPAENSEIIESFLLSHPEYAAEDFSVGGLKSSLGMLSLYPDIHKTDGFFIARMRKVK